MSEWESQPDDVFRTARQRCESNLTKVAKFVNSEPENLVFVENPTTAINAVVSSLKLTSEDVIVMASHAYEGISNTMHALAEKWGFQMHIIDIPWPIKSEEDIVEVRMCFLIFSFFNQKLQYILIKMNITLNHLL